MCIDRKRYVSRSHLVSTGAFQSGFIECDCGVCLECLEKKKQNYFIRGFYEAQNTFIKNGFCVFDTLTYDPLYRPYLKQFFPDLPDHLNFMCFNCDHLKLFFKRLRKRIGKSQVRYFVASEYGTDDRYQHCPHYHVIFFVNDSKLNPVDFSYAVSSAWYYGRTDGVKYKGRRYFFEKRCFRPSRARRAGSPASSVSSAFSGSHADRHFSNVLNYVQKYITKDTEFQSEIDRRLWLLSQFGGDQVRYRKLNPLFIEVAKPGEIAAQSKMVDLYHVNRCRFLKMRRLVSQFTLQSYGFGMHDVSRVGRQVKMSFPSEDFMQNFIDNRHLIVSVNGNLKRFQMPFYYFRKMFYETYKNQYGVKAWRLNHEGLDFMVRSYDDRLRRTSDKLLSGCINAGIVLPDGQLRRLAEYVVVYRGALFCSGSQSDPRFDYMTKIIGNCSPVVFNHNSPAVRERFGRCFVSSIDFGVADHFLDAPIQDWTSPDVWFNFNCFFDPDLENILEKIGFSKRKLDLHKNDAYFYREKLRKKFAN